MINKKTQDIARVLLNEKDKKLKLRELSAKAGVSLGMTVKIVNALESCGQLEKKKGIRAVKWKKLLFALAYACSIEENKKIEFLGAERAQYLIKKIGNLLRNEKYAFTLFSATEIISPYVAPDKVHLYILDKDKEKISKLLVEEGIAPAEKGNIICYEVDENHFYGSKEVRGVNVISLPQLYIDLVSYGGRGEEAAEHVLRLMENV